MLENIHYTVREVEGGGVEIQPGRIQSLSGKRLKYCERFYSKLTYETRSKGDSDYQQLTVH